MVTLTYHKGEGLHIPDSAMSELGLDSSDRVRLEKLGHAVQLTAIGDTSATEDCGALPKKTLTEEQLARYRQLLQKLSGSLPHLDTTIADDPEDNPWMS